MNSMHESRAHLQMQFREFEAWDDEPEGPPAYASAWRRLDAGTPAVRTRVAPTRKHGYTPLAEAIEPAGGIDEAGIHGGCC